jgi:sporulation protein YlmC with PRC-barrel domain
MDYTTSANDIISSDKVEGTAVYNTAGDKLGSIDDLMIDKRSGEVRYAVLEFGGFLGLGTDRYPLPWSVLKYDTSLNGYVVPLDSTTLEGAPRYAANDVPDYTNEFGTRVNGYYGMNR